MTWTTFTRYMMDNKTNIPAGVWQAARRAGLERRNDILRAGKASETTYFDDIIRPLETSIAPK